MAGEMRIHCKDRHELHRTIEEAGKPHKAAATPALTRIKRRYKEFSDAQPDCDA